MASVQPVRTAKNDTAEHYYQLLARSSCRNSDEDANTVTTSGQLLLASGKPFNRHLMDITFWGRYGKKLSLNGAKNQY